MKKKLLILSALIFLSVGESQAYDEPWQAIKSNDFPAAEELVRASLQGDPTQAENRFLLARLLAWQKRYAEAVQEYDILLAEYPGHADYLLGKGQTLYWQGSLAGALQMVDLAIANTPHYKELWLLKIKILMSQEESQQARAANDQAENYLTGAQLAEIRQLLASYQQSAPEFQDRSEVEVGFAYEYLSDDFAPWTSAYMRGEWFYKPRATLYTQGSFVNRFDKNDREISIGTYQPLGSLYTYQLEVGYSPIHEILAEYSFMGGLSRSVMKNWDVGFNVRHSIYTNTYSNLLSLTVGRYFYSQRLAYTLYVSKVEDASETFSHRLQWSLYYDLRNSIGLYVATGIETESVGEIAGSTRFITSSVFSYGIAGRHWLKEGHYSLTYQLWQHDQGNLYTRWGGALGFRIQF